jgi:hypothetical protein
MPMANKIRTRKSGDRLEINSEIEWKYAYFKNGDKWIAFSPKLEIALQSDSLESLKQDMVEAVDTLFNELVKTGKLESFLKAKKWVAKKPLPKKSLHSSVDMSFRFQRVDANDLHEAVC